MELLKCPQCARRFIVAEQADQLRRRCPHCRCELSLIVRSLPGPAEQISRELKARRLDVEPGRLSGESGAER